MRDDLADQINRVGGIGAILRVWKHQAEGQAASSGPPSPCARLGPQVIDFQFCHSFPRRGAKMSNLQEATFQSPS